MVGGSAWLHVIVMITSRITKFLALLRIHCIRSTTWYVIHTSYNPSLSKTKASVRGTTM